MQVDWLAYFPPQPPNSRLICPSISARRRRCKTHSVAMASTASSSWALWARITRCCQRKSADRPQRRGRIRQQARVPVIAGVLSSTNRAIAFRRDAEKPADAV